MSVLSICAYLRALLSRIFKIGIWLQRFLSISRRLVRLLSVWLYKVFLGRRGGSGGPSPLSQDSQIARSSKESEGQRDHACQTSVSGSLNEPKSYTITPNGHSISLEGISASAYPFASGNIRKTASRTSLRSTDISHRSRPGSPAGSFSKIELQTVLPIPRRHPAPRHQYSRSAPDINIIPDQSDSPSPSILVTSPVDDSPTRLNYLADSLSVHNVAVQAIDGVSERETQPRLQVPSITSSNTHVHVLEYEDGTGNLTFQPDIVPLPSHSSCASSLANRDIQPVMPRETERYERRTRIKKETSHIVIRCVQLEYSDPGLPDGWIRYAHPEGARYFYHPQWKVYTDAEIYDSVVLGQLLKDLKVIESYLEANDLSVPLPNGEIVINVYRTGESFQSKYYCVDHEKQLIFFVDDFKASFLQAWAEVPGVISWDHLSESYLLYSAIFDLNLGEEYEIMAQYWYFVLLYPHSLEIKEDMLRELRGIVLHLVGDSMTSPFSTAQYTLEDLHKILSLVGELANNLGAHSPGSTSLFARQMFIFNHARFLNVHGQSYARIERNFSIYGEPIYQRTWLIKTLSLPLFCAPEVHLKTLQSMWVDRMLHQSVWAECMKRMNEEWQEFVVIATVVLNANVAFLAIQTVDVNNHPYRSPAQIASYVSVIANIASIILGLLLMRQNRTKTRETSDQVQNFLDKKNHSKLGLETLAILYSLPYALLMWGMVSFLTAFCFMCFIDSNGSTRITVGLVCCSMAILIVWCIRSFWETKPEPENTNRPLAYPIDSSNHSNDDTRTVASQTSDVSRGYSLSSILSRLSRWLSPTFGLIGRKQDSMSMVETDTQTEV